jgi:hypothetical protein
MAPASCSVFQITIPPRRIAANYCAIGDPELSHMQKMHIARPGSEAPKPARKSPLKLNETGLLTPDLLCRGSAQQSLPELVTLAQSPWRSGATLTSTVYRRPEERWIWRPPRQAWRSSRRRGGGCRDASPTQEFARGAFRDHAAPSS